jgi:hypothetical protein
MEAYVKKKLVLFLPESSPKREKRQKPVVISINCGRSNRLKKI